MYAMAMCLMAAEVALAVACLVHFSLTGVWITQVLVLGFLVPAFVVFVLVTTSVRSSNAGDNSGAFAVTLAISIPLSLICVVSLLIFGAATLGS